MTVLAAGQLIAERYELTSRIAIGGMGEVWEAADTRLGRSVAVKILRPELSGDDEFRHRFRIEARTVASLDHPGIAHVHDYGEDEDHTGRLTSYLVMELVRGEPLSTLVARGPMGTDEALRIVEQAAWALHAAHERGFVHRDVKPGNILVASDGRVKLTDFGIAKAANAVPMTRSGMVMGTAHYIAPEQATGGEAGPTGDVYSLGIVGYECLAGHRPFRGDSAVEVAAMQVRDAPPPLPDTVPVHVRALIEAVLAKDPALRYATGEEFAVAVAAVRRGEAAPLPSGSGGAGAAAARASAPAEPPKRRRRWAKTDPEAARHARGRAAPAAVEPADVEPADERVSSEPAGAVPAALDQGAPPATPQPYAAPPATPQPYAAPPATPQPYAAPPATPQPYAATPQPYAVPPATPQPYPAPPQTYPKREPQAYAEPPATPRPYAARPPTPQTYPRPYTHPTATPPPYPKPEFRLPTPPPTPAVRAPRAQTAPSAAPSTTPTGGGRHVAPLNVTPRSGMGRTFLLVLFVLLTVAAVVVGYLVFVQGVSGTGGILGASGAAPTDTTPNVPMASASASNVTGREDGLVGWAAAGAPLVAMISGRGVR